MKFIATALPGVVVVEPRVHRDPRGFFLETFRADPYREAGIPGPFVQDNHSRSEGPVLRGLHAQRRKPQGKLLRVVEGEVFDVAVDIRRGSPTFRRWVGVTLSADDCRQIYVPPGFAHGFCVTRAPAQVEYKCTDYYDAADELTIAWNDPDIAIDWPVADPVLSAKDRGAPRLAELFDLLPVYHPEG